MSKFKFTIGADPEFTLTSFGKKLSAIDEMQKAYKGKEPADQETGGYKIGEKGIAGWDGCAQTGEIRPHFSNDPEEVKNNIGELLKNIYQKMPIYSLVTTNEYAPIGGHIHLTIPTMESFQSNSTKIAKMIRTLDTLFLPILTTENEKSELIRTKSYGKLSDYKKEGVRIQTAEGTKDIIKIEYRTPNAEWIQNPKICKAVLSYIAVCWNEILNNTKNLKEIKELEMNDASTREAISLLYLGHFKFASKIINEKIRESIKKFEKYQEYKEDIDYIFNPEQVKKDKEQTQYKAEIGWGFKKTQKFTKTIINQAEKIIKKLANQFNIEDISIDDRIYYNDDMNCKEIARNIATFLELSNINTNQKYMIYGLRKGIESPIIYNPQKNTYLTGLEQVQTENDLAVIEMLTNKMKTRINQIYSMNIIKNTILIGLPYKMRIENKLKPILELILNIEKNKYKEITLKEKQKTIKETNKKVKQEDKITKAYEPNEQPSYDTRSQGRQLAQRAIEQIREEEEYRERDNEEYENNETEDLNNEEEDEDEENQ